MELFTGFLVGLFGSLHCIGMCGPIALALPGGSFRSAKFYTGRLLYNFGRIIIYSFFGLIFGILGKSISLISIEFQQGVTIATGIIIIIAVILPGSLKQRFLKILPFSFYTLKIKTFFAGLFKNNSSGSLFFIGILNGFLPCGFVYMGIAGALITGDILYSVLYMALFGLGTTPIMFSTAVAGNFITIQLRQRISQIIPFLAIILAVLFILRGLGLGIPYISPKTEKINKMLEKKDGQMQTPTDKKDNIEQHH